MKSSKLIFKHSMVSEIDKFLTNTLDLSTIDADANFNDFSNITIFSCNHGTSLSEYNDALSKSKPTMVFVFSDHYWYGDLSNSIDKNSINHSLNNIVNAVNKHDINVILLTENFYSDIELGDKCPKNLSIVVSPTFMYEPNGCNIQYDLNITKHIHRKWHVLCLNNNPRPHRVGVLLYLNYLGMNRNMHSSFISKERWEANTLYDYDTILSYIYPNGKIKDSLNNISLESIYRDYAEYIFPNKEIDAIPSIKSDLPIPGGPRRFFSKQRAIKHYNKKLIPLYENAIVDIITESTALENTAQLTEKFVHCVIGRCFPIIIGIYKNVELYRNMGYDMFDDIIDHSYDFEPNPFYRMKMAIDSNIEILTNKDLAYSFYEANKKRLDANVENYIKQYDIILGNTIGNLDAELSKFSV